ncbi:DNA mismatch repair endonuclease MutL [Geomonas diazotrophica]|uniref:DNA mismatch repair endonuclease MutL n=1 Tax=Geomonas diazotrophica TaxID=2843197 RepID=UPI0034619100
MTLATKIRILPENLTNKIAAGEVVERPASVAKELVENALDAGSKEVVVEIESGGRRLIKVTDSGSGMSREDALLALERHATSKIASDEDLFALSTLGFRGEALPSVASVSRLTISTRTSDSLEGTEIYVEGGRIKEVKECGMAAGTVIAVRNLFFNTPARLKFMKSAETEGGHVGELLTRLAISRPDVRFTYKNDGKVVFRALDADLKERVATLLGRSIASFLYPVSYEVPGGVRVTGLVAAPECSRSAASHLYTYINGRFIKDKVVQHAILQAYRNFLERGRYPVVAVFIDIAPGEVDVNVHPTKHEVRFREQGKVHDTIQYAVESVLKQTPWLKRPAVPASAPPELGAEQRSSTVSAPLRAPGPSCASQGASPHAVAPTPAAVATAGQAPTHSVHQMTQTVQPATQSVSEAKVAEIRELLVGYQPKPQPPLRPQYHFESPARRGEEAAPAPCPQGPASQEPEVAPSQGSEAPGYFSSLAVIGQFNASYILCQRGTDLVLIDQHAAHERVAFERLKGEFAGKEVDSQGLLFPETLELSFRESAVLGENLEELRRLGFSFEEFGGNTWLLNGVPQILSGTDYLRTIRDILEELSSLSRSRTFTDIQEDLLARIACHSVVRGRRTLTAQEISALFRQMDETDFSSNCPHGRPVMQTLTLAEVEKMFKRV